MSSLFSEENILLSTFPSLLQLIFHSILFRLYWSIIFPHFWLFSLSRSWIKVKLLKIVIKVAWKKLMELFRPFEHLFYEYRGKVWLAIEWKGGKIDLFSFSCTNVIYWLPHDASHQRCCTLFRSPRYNFFFAGLSSGEKINSSLNERAWKSSSIFFLLYGELENLLLKLIERWKFSHYGLIIELIPCSIKNFDEESCIINNFL